MSAAFRLARPDEGEALLAFLLEHGPNPWNHLPEAPLRRHFAGLADGTTQALLAERGEALAGFVSFQRTRGFAHYQPEGQSQAPQVYVCEAVVHRLQVGRGLGSALLRRVVERLAGQGFAFIYIDRHADNAASAGMMRKAGFVEIDTYPDPMRRPHGSGCTTVCRWRG